MANALFHRSSLALLAECGQIIEYKGDISDFPRLHEILDAENARAPGNGPPEDWRVAPVDIKLDFGWAGSDARIPVVSGRALARVTAMCQRCLEWFQLDLDAPMNLAFASSAAEVDLTDGCADYEVWELGEDIVRPIDLVEESLVMAMPLAPAHDAEECRAFDDGGSENDGPSLRPFADLRSQLAKQKT